MSVSDAAIMPPVQDSAVANFQPRRRHKSSTVSARVRVSVIAAAVTVATACAASPSPRPVKPSFSVVVALTLTRPAVEARGSSPMRATIAARCGPILGRSQMRVTSTWAMAPPCARDQIGGMAQESVGRRRRAIADRSAENACRYRRRRRRRESRRSMRAALHRRRNGRPAHTVVWNFHAAKPEMVAGAEGVHVKTLAGADVAHGRGKAPLRVAQIILPSSP